MEKERFSRDGQLRVYRHGKCVDYDGKNSAGGEGDRKCAGAAGAGSGICGMLFQFVYGADGAGAFMRSDRLCVRRVLRRDGDCEVEYDAAGGHAFCPDLLRMGSGGRILLGARQILGFVFKCFYQYGGHLCGHLGDPDNRLPQAGRADQ